MDILRKFISVVLFFIIGLFLSLAGIFFIFSVVLNPVNVKKTIASDQGYQKIDQAIKTYFNSPVVQSQDAGTAEFINKNINSQFLQGITEQAIDKYYAWAKGDQVDMKISLGNLIDTNQIIAQLQAQGIEIPADQLAQIQNVQLPVPQGNSRNQLKIFYDLVFGGYYYLLLIAAVLIILLMLIRFNLKDRLYYLFHIALWPTLSFLVSYLAIFGFRYYYLKNDRLFASVSDSYRAMAYDKVKSIVGMLLDAQLQLILIGITASILTLVGFLVANHYYKKVHPDETPVIAPPTAPTELPKPVTSPPVATSKIETTPEEKKQIESSTKPTKT